MKLPRPSSTAILNINIFRTVEISDGTPYIKPDGRVKYRHTSHAWRYGVGIKRGAQGVGYLLDMPVCPHEMCLAVRQSGSQLACCLTRNDCLDCLVAQQQHTVASKIWRYFGGEIVTEACEDGREIIIKRFIRRLTATQLRTRTACACSLLRTLSAYLAVPAILRP